MEQYASKEHSEANGERAGNLIQVNIDKVQAQIVKGEHTDVNHGQWHHLLCHTPIKFQIGKEGEGRDLAIERVGDEDAYESDHQLVECGGEGIGEAELGAVVQDDLIEENGGDGDDKVEEDDHGDGHWVVFAAV